MENSQKTDFANEIEKHVARLGIAGALAAFAEAGDPISRRTLEGWRYGKAPRGVIRRGALAILSDKSEAGAKKEGTRPGPLDRFGALPVSLSWVDCGDQRHPPFQAKIIDRFFPEPCLVLVMGRSGVLEIEGPAEFSFFGSGEWRIVSGGRRLERHGSQVLAWAPFPKLEPTKTATPTL